MSEENKSNLMALSIVAIVAIIGISFLFMGRGNANSAGKATGVMFTGNENLVGEASAPLKKPQINANSCKADSTCEMSNGLVDGTLTAGVTKINGHITASSIFVGQILTVPGGGDLVLTPDSKNVIVDGSLTLGELFMYHNGNVITTVEGSGRPLYLSSDNKLIVMEGTIQLGLYQGSGNAYACLDPDGKLFRSQTPCV